jgi:hypothetical protein
VSDTGDGEDDFRFVSQWKFSSSGEIDLRGKAAFFEGYTKSYMRDTLHFWVDSNATPAGDLLATTDNPGFPSLGIPWNTHVLIDKWNTYLGQVGSTTLTADGVTYPSVLG